MGEVAMNQHAGTTITDLQELVERYAAKQALDEVGPHASMVEASKRQKEIAKDITGGEWFRFLNEDRLEDPDYDRDAEDM
jgi:hypothetical protein